MKLRLTTMAMSVLLAVATIGFAPISAQAATTGPGYLVALGDSVAAGDGLTPTSGHANDEVCRRSNEAYSTGVAADHGLTAVNLACSGGRVWDGVLTDQEMATGDVTAQRKQLRPYVRPAAITMTVGANDVFWSQWLRYCAATACGSERDLESFEGLSANMGAQLWTALFWLQSRQADRTFVTGYYDVFAGTTECAATSGIDAQEAAWLSNRLADLNNRIQATTAYFGGITFVPVDFGDRGVCSSNSLVQSQSDPAPFHPTREGQQVIRDAVNAKW